jgi:DNA-binding winged helix-turn-helix (wHTH) protein
VRYRFDRFILSPARRVLRRDGRDVALIPRYFDLLLLLVEQRNRAVTRQEIFDRVWADVVVSDGALTQAIRTIRRVLDDDARDVRFIRTVSRHGYQFVWTAVVEEADEGSLAVSTDAAPGVEPGDAYDRMLDVLLGSSESGPATEEERHDAAVRLHELGTEEALRRLDRRPGHEEARALLRDARWDAPMAGPVPLLSSQGRARAILDVIALRGAHAAHLASRRWASAAGASALAGLVAGLAGGAALALVPGSTSGVEAAIALSCVGVIAGAAGGAAVGAGLAAAEAIARSARAMALIGAGAVTGSVAGTLAHHLARALVGGIFGRDLVAMAGGVEGLVVGGAVGAGYALATRRLAQGGMAAPRGPARWSAALTTGAVAAASGVLLAASGRHMVGSSLDVMAGAFAGSGVGLDPLARMLGEDALRPVTRMVVSAFEALMFGTGLAFGLMRRPRVSARS